MRVSGVGTAAGYMKTIHHCIFTVKLLTGRSVSRYIGFTVPARTNTNVSDLRTDRKVWRISLLLFELIQLFWGIVVVKLESRDEAFPPQHEKQKAQIKWSKCSSLLNLFLCRLHLLAHCTRPSTIPPSPSSSSLTRFLSSSAPLWPS